MKKSTVLKILSAALASALALSLAGCTGGVSGETKNYNVNMTLAQSEEQYSSTVEMLANIRPTVVDVTSYNDVSSSAGSGVVISKAESGNQYFIITNHHVIDGGKSFTVDVLSIADDGTESTQTYEARLVGSSLKRDIAVLTVTPPEGVSFSLATFISDSDSVKVGTEVYAIGNPLGILGGTVTHGIVSATRRAVNISEIGSMTLMQTDALTNGGNSGGGLFDSDGKLVGIINSGYETYNDRQVEGLNFAIPANDARFAAKELIDTHVEAGDEVVSYGYVEGDARMDLTFSYSTLYSDSSLLARGNYLIAQAAESSPIYASWTNTLKAVRSITVNGEKTDLSASGSGSYSLTTLANEVIGGVKAGDKVTIEYKDILTRTTSAFFGTSYYYLGGETKSVTVTAQQYIYQPE